MSLLPEEAFGTHVRHVRESKGMKQTELGRRIGDQLGVAAWRSPQVSGLESGTRALPLRDMVAVAAALEVPLVELLLSIDDDEDRYDTGIEMPNGDVLFAKDWDAVIAPTAETETARIEAAMRAMEAAADEMLQVTKEHAGRSAKAKNKRAKR